MSTTPEFYVYALFRENGVPFYIGKGKGDRWACHERVSSVKNSHKIAIIRGMHARGFSLIKAKIHENLTETVAHAYEIALIKAIGREPHGPLVNMTDGGDGQTGLKHTERARALISLAARTRERRPEEGAAISAGKRGTKASPEARANMSAAQKGKTIPPEVREKMSLAQRGKPKTPEHIAKVVAARRGIVMSAEWRAKIAAGNRGKKHSPERIEKSAAARRGKKQTPEHIEKRAAAHRGRKATPEARANMSAAHRKKAAPKSPEGQASLSL